MARQREAEDISNRLFAALLRLLPEEFRDRFRGEMQSVFADQRQDAQQSGRAAQARFWWETIRGLFATAVREHTEILVQDADYALRMMRKDLSFTFIAILVLGLAIGAATAAFSAADAILIRPLPFAEGNRLVQLKQLEPAVGVDNMGFSVKEIEDYRSRSRTLGSVVEYHNMMFTLLGGREPERVDTAVVSANFFRVLGVSALHGRTFMDEDDGPNAKPVLVLSYEFWQKSFGGDPNVVGRSYSMNDKEHVVVGVLPPIPQFPGVVDVYMPTSACPTRSGASFRENRTSRMMTVFATLKPGVTLPEAEDDLRGIAKHLRSAYPESYPAAKGYDIAILPVHEQLTSKIRPVLIGLGAAAFLLLLLACFNVAGLMLSRILSRSKELMVRAALGASHGRIVRSFLTEGMLLACAGGVLALVLAFWSVDVLVPFSARFTTLASELRIGPQAIAFCFVLSILCGFVIGFMPAIGMRQMPLFTAQMENMSSPARMSSRTRGILVAGQLAVSVILLVGAGLTLRTLFQLEHMDAGFRPSGVTTARIYTHNDSFQSIYHSLMERTRRLDGVESVALSSTFPLSERGDEYEYALTTDKPSSGDQPKPRTAAGRAVTPGYFSIIGMHLLAGRDFNEGDTQQEPRVSIVNEHLASHYWPGQSAIGKKIRFSPSEEATIVGVVGNVRHRGLDQEPIDEAYCAFAQTNNYFMDLIVRGTRSAHELAPEVAWIVHDLDRDAVITDVEALTDVRKDSLAPRRNTALLFSIFAGLALAITASGISGLMTLEVSERKHEIGIRMALGATPRRVMGSMMTRVTAIIVAGLGCGAAVAWLMSAPMAKLVYGILPRDSVTFAVSAVLLVVVAMASSFLPLTRIAKLDPTVLLRTE
ncbi:MAG TPA: ABC transporter permease [Terriglobales bacterium]|jgi:predicted permease|nr:ABC transporter permease [Terriglobales bacterium]